MASTAPVKKMMIQLHLIFPLRLNPSSTTPPITIIPTMQTIHSLLYRRELARLMPISRKETEARKMEEREQTKKENKRAKPLYTTLSLVWSGLVCATGRKKKKKAPRSSPSRQHQKRSKLPPLASSFRPRLLHLSSSAQPSIVARG